MTTTKWTKLDSGEWAVRIEGSSYPQGTMEGFPCVVTNNAGTKKEVVLGPLVRHWLGKGGRHIDIYSVDEAQTAKYGRVIR